MYEIAKNNIVDDNIIVYLNDSFYEGLCGLTANKLMFEYGKAVIILTKKDKMIIGSGRAPQDLNIYEYLKQISDLFDSYGGHNQAIGLRINEDNYQMVLDYINDNPITYKEGTKDVIIVDQEIVNNDLLLELEQLEPFGTDFKQPLFMIKDVEYTNKVIIKDKYPKFNLNQFVEAISFNPSFIDKQFNDMIFTLRRDNLYPNRLSLTIEDLI